MNINSILVLGKKESHKDYFIDYIYDKNYLEKKQDNYDNEVLYKDVVYINDVKINIMELADLTENNANDIRKKVTDEITKGEAYSNINNRIHSIIYCISVRNFSEFELEDVLRPISIAANKIVVAITDCNEATMEEIDELDKKLSGVVHHDEIIRLNVREEEFEDENVFVAERKDAMRAITINMWERLKIRSLGEAYIELNQIVDDWKKYCYDYVSNNVNILNVKKTKINSEKIFTDMLNKQFAKERENIEKSIKESVDYFTKVDEVLNTLVDDEYQLHHKNIEIVYPEDLTKNWTGDYEADMMETKFEGKATKESIIGDIDEFYAIAKRQIAIIMETYKNVLH